MQALIEVEVLVIGRGKFNASERQRPLVMKSGDSSRLSVLKSRISLAVVPIVCHFGVSRVRSP